LYYVKKKIFNDIEKDMKIYCGMYLDKGVKSNFVS
jgi:hypothetical protein